MSAHSLALSHPELQRCKMSARWIAAMYHATRRILLRRVQMRKRWRLRNRNRFRIEEASYRSIEIATDASKLAIHSNLPSSPLIPIPIPILIFVMYVYICIFVIRSFIIELIRWNFKLKSFGKISLLIVDLNFQNFTCVLLFVLILWPNGNYNRRLFSGIELLMEWNS